MSIEGDAFHRYDRAAMKAELDARKAAGDQTFSHFSYEANELAELESIFRHLWRPPARAAPATMFTMPTKAARWGVEPGSFTEWAAVRG